jgi:hypothetical protein
VKLKPRLVAAALVLMTAALLPGITPTEAARFRAAAVNVPCGQQAQVHLDYFNWQPTPRTHRLTFDASGGGTVYFYVVPNLPTRIDIPTDTVTRSYSMNVANTADAPNPVGRQVYARADLQPCSRDLVITNVSVTVVSSAQD